VDKSKLQNEPLGVILSMYISCKEFVNLFV
jgi:hypothetical protein